MYMEAFRWNKEESTWHLFDEEAGIHCYLHCVIAPVIPGTEHKATEMPYIYTLVKALLEENETWTLTANLFSNVYEALEYGAEVLGYFPKFRDPQEDIYYATKEEK